MKMATDARQNSSHFSDRFSDKSTTFILRSDQFCKVIVRGILFGESVSSKAQFASVDDVGSGLGRNRQGSVLVGQ
jgi:hypothetical protein